MREIFKLCLGGRGPMQIANELQRCGVPTPSARKGTGHAKGQEPLSRSTMCSGCFSGYSPANCCGGHEQGEFFAWIGHKPANYCSEREQWELSISLSAALGQRAFGKPSKPPVSRSPTFSVSIFPIHYIYKAQRLTKWAVKKGTAVDKQGRNDYNSMQ